MGDVEGDVLHADAKLAGVRAEKPVRDSTRTDGKDERRTQSTGSARTASQNEMQALPAIPGQT